MRTRRASNITNQLKRLANDPTMIADLGRSNSRSRPRLSILVPTFNRERCVSQCVAHLLAGHAVDIEVVVRNNASTDGTQAALGGIRDPRLRYIHSGVNIGAVTFLEVAKAASGEIITWISDEDECDFESLAHVVALFDAHPECNVVIGSVVFGRGSTPIIFGDDVSRDTAANYFRLLTFSGCAGMFIRKSAFDRTCNFELPDLLAAYQRWNYYPVGHLAARCLGVELVTTSRNVATQVCHAQTTRDWGSTERQATTLKPHYFPESILDRCYTNCTFVAQTELGFWTRVVIVKRLLGEYWRGLRWLVSPGTARLLADNYTDPEVELFLENVRAARLGTSASRFQYFARSVIRMSRQWYHRRSVPLHG